MFMAARVKPASTSRMAPARPAGRALRKSPQLLSSGGGDAGVTALWSGRDDEQGRAPRFQHGGIGPEEAKASLSGEEVIQVRIADMKVPFGLPLGFHIGQPMLEHCEVGRDVESFP